jgi:dephospho-CoA kinase
MRTVALTGGIATGKSYVLDRCRERGVPCLDADDLAHGVTAAGTEATAAIAARFGADVLTAEGAVDRAKLGAIVFADPVARRELEALTHPAVYRAIAAGLRGIELTERPAFAIVAIPLLYETAHASDFDRVIATTCAAETQVERLMARGFGRTEAQQRISAQLPSADKSRQADFVVDTDGTFADTNAQVDRVLAALGAA